MRHQEVLDVPVPRSSVVVEVQSVAGGRLDVRLEHRSVGEDRAGSVGDGRRGTAGVEAVVATVWEVVCCMESQRWRGRNTMKRRRATQSPRGGLTAGEDEDGALERARGGQATQCQELANGDRLLVLLAVVQDSGIKVSRKEEEVLLGVDVGIGQIPIRIVERVDGRRLQRRDKVRQAEVVNEGVEEREVQGGPEAERLVEVRLLEVGAGAEEADEGAVGGPAGEDDAVGDVGVLGCERVGLRGAEGVANVDDFAEGVVHHGEGAIA